MEKWLDVLFTYWPVIVSALAGLGVGFLTYLTKRTKYKTALVEKETENLELQKAIYEGSYIICPECGKKIFLKDSKVYTGGIKDENETTCK